MLEPAPPDGAVPPDGPVDALVPAERPCGSPEDPANCGRCGNDCAALANVAPGAAVTCVEGRCVVPPAGCKPGFAHCSANPQDGCEASLDASASCGLCGRSCAVANGASMCVARACTAPTCNSGFKVEGAACAACKLAVPALCMRGASGISCARADAAGNLGSPTVFVSPAFSDLNGFSDAKFYSGIQYVDADGDGQIDVCVRSIYGPACTYGKGGTSFEVGAAQLYTIFADEQGWGSTRSGWGSVQFPDIDGDGKADVCGRAGTGTICALSQGRNFGSYTGAFVEGTSDAAGFNVAPSYWATLQFPDVDGDGRADHCARGPQGIVCGLSDGVTFPLFGSWDAGKAFSDAAGFDQSGRWETIQFPDLDGDGKADICGLGTKGLLCGLSNGKDGFGPILPWAPAFADGGATPWANDGSHFLTIQYPDLNGDGKQDVCGRGVDGLWCGLSTGKAFATPTRWAPEFTDAGGWKVVRLAGSIQFLDMDGDGKDDVCGRGPTGVRCGLSDGTSAFTGWKTFDIFSDAAGWGMPGRVSTTALVFLDAGTCRSMKRRTPALRPAARLPF